MLSVAGVLRALLLAGSNLPAFKELFDQVTATFSSADQETLRAAYEDAKLDNDEGHARLQEKLAAAAQA